MTTLQHNPMQQDRDRDEATRLGLSLPRYKAMMRAERRNQPKPRLVIPAPPEAPPDDAPAPKPTPTPKGDRLNITSADGKHVNLRNLYKGASAFLLGGGVSLESMDLAPLDEPGILTMAMNNAAKLHRPDLWACADSAHHFIRSVWDDPRILKFAPTNRRKERIFDSTKWDWTDHRVHQCPSVLHYQKGDYNPDNWLTSPNIGWNLKKLGGGRSVMLVALRLLHWLGVRDVYLLGVDFRMEAGKSYAFDQSKNEKAARSNNRTYRRLDKAFTELRPKFEAAGFHVHNATPGSGLTAFEHVPYAEALQRVRESWGNIDVHNEPTKDLYTSKKKHLTKRGAA